MIDILLNGSANELEINKEVAEKHILMISENNEFEQYKNMISFRYDKNSDNSLEKIWNKANHLITTQKYTKTENGSINFIFADDEIRNNFIDYYYTVIPYIMSYAVDLIYKMFENIIKADNQSINNNKLIRHFKLARSYDLLEPNSIQDIAVRCPKCGQLMKIKRSRAYKRCMRCFRRINLHEYIVYKA